MQATLFLLLVLKINYNIEIYWERIEIRNLYRIRGKIKWDHGNLAKDLNHWHFFEKPKKFIHKKKNIHLNYSKINFHNWTIALA